MIASFKLRFLDTHVRIVPAEGLDGKPFAGPGIDVHGAEAVACFDLGKPVIAWLLAREPSVVLRALSADLVRRRVLVSFEDIHATGERPRPIVLRIEPPESSDLLDLAAPLVHALEGHARVALTARLKRAAP